LICWPRRSLHCWGAVPARKHLDLLASGLGARTISLTRHADTLWRWRLRERTMQSRDPSPTAAEAVTDSDQMPLFAGWRQFGEPNHRTAKITMSKLARTAWLSIWQKLSASLRAERWSIPIAAARNALAKGSPFVIKRRSRLRLPSWLKMGRPTDAGAGPQRVEEVHHLQCGSDPDRSSARTDARGLLSRCRGERWRYRLLVQAFRWRFQFTTPNASAFYVYDRYRLLQPVCS
jgi:hypothetical protein